MVLLDLVTQEAVLLCVTTLADHIKAFMSLVRLQEWVYLMPSLNSKGGNKLLMHFLMVKKFSRDLAV